MEFFGGPHAILTHNAVIGEQSFVFTFLNVFKKLDLLGSPVQLLLELFLFLEGFGPLLLVHFDCLGVPRGQGLISHGDF